MADDPGLLRHRGCTRVQLLWRRASRRGGPVPVGGPMEATKTDQNTILEIQDLKVSFTLPERTVNAVNGVSLRVGQRQSVGVVGESGCGKSVTSLAVLRLLARNARVDGGRIMFRRPQDNQMRDLLSYKSNGPEMREIRGGEIAMIFQEPMTAFSPVHRIGDQITDVMLLHGETSREEARTRAITLMKQVGITSAADRIDDYTFQFSGGMRQRAMIAMALACNPSLLIADEPTTALDVTIQAQVIEQIKRVQDEFGLALMLITHDLGVIAQTVDYVYVMYLGRVVEHGPVEAIFADPKHPYTIDLLRSIPRATGRRGRLNVIRGSVPNYLPSGCPFHTRCTRVVGDQCMTRWPAETTFDAGHGVRCFLYNRDHGDTE
ncbi:MAG: ABC transporter ATP-binding protein [Spirochaetaceae bacterium]|nr:MAG: ABC transporter ATP-binding protein [Spirochaetaceae bacterium]